jgi:hypothetical protein
MLTARRIAARSRPPVNNPMNALMKMALNVPPRIPMAIAGSGSPVFCHAT